MTTFFKVLFQDDGEGACMLCGHYVESDEDYENTEYKCTNEKCNNKGGL